MKLYNDHFQNYKRYSIPKAQLIIADIPFNIGVDAYASNPMWYKDGDNQKGENKRIQTVVAGSDGREPGELGGYERGFFGGAETVAGVG